MIRQDQVQVRMEIDGKQAISEIGKLENEAYEFRQELKLAKEDQAALEKESKNLEKSGKRIQELTAKLEKMRAEGKENTKAFKQANEQLEKAQKEYNLATEAAQKLNATKAQVQQLEESLDGVNEKLREQRKEAGLAGMTMRQLVSHKRDLIRQQSLLTVGTEQWREMGRQIQEVDTHIVSARRNVVQSEAAWMGLGKSLKHFSVLAIGILGAQGIIGSLKAFITGGSEFEQAMSNMSALTGATGEELEFYSQKARELGETTTLSAQQAAEAFTIIGSKKPELLENRDALVETTKAAITLAEAAGITLPEAADALTNTLNQFGEGADQAQKYINVLAAGSKFGAGNIEFLNESVKKFGPAAKEMGVSFEESVAMMEVFAEKGLDASTAGTNFRNILLKMAAAGEDTNPAVVGMATAIENLGKKQMDVTELTKMFGVENIVAAQIMIGSSERFVEMTAKVTGTSVAVEQARVRIDNFKGDVKQLGSITQDYIIVIGSWITDGLRPLVQNLTAVMRILKGTPRFLKENKDLILLFATALVTFNSAQIISTGLMLKDIAVKKAQAIWTGAVTTAQNLLNAALTANPIGLMIKAAALLAAGFVVLYNRSETVRGAISGIAEVAITMWEIVKETFGKFADAFIAFKDGNVSDGFKLLGKAIVDSNPIALAIKEGKRLGEAFNKGYAEKIAEGVQNAPVDGISMPNGEIVPNPVVDPNKINDDNADDYTGQAIKVMRSTQEAISSPEAGDPFEVVGAHFDKMKELHEKFGLDITAQEKARDEVRAANAKAFREKELQDEQALADAKLLLAQGLSSALGGIIDFVGNKQGELTGFQKALTLAQIAIDTAAALSKSIPLALDAAKAGGPAAPFLVAGYIATMAGTIFGAAARAKSALSDANTPEWQGGGDRPNTGRSRPGNTQKKSFYFGGPTGDGLGFGDQWGEYAGYVHRHEYVIPQAVRQEPIVRMQIEPILEALRMRAFTGRSFYSGGDTSPIAASQSSAPPAPINTRTDQLLETLIQEVRKWPREVKGKWVISELEDIQEERDYLDNRYGAK